jgi:hypothetical protein
MIKCERQRGRMTQRKLKLTGGNHRLAQVFIRPEVFSIHMKGLKIRAQPSIYGGTGKVVDYGDSSHCTFVTCTVYIQFYIPFFLLFIYCIAI